MVKTLITQDDIRNAFKVASAALHKHLRQKYNDKQISYQVAVNQHEVLVNAEIILLKMEETGVTRAELIEWLDHKSDIRAAAVRAEANYQQLKMKLL
jgi:hypothetical protein